MNKEQLHFTGFSDETGSITNDQPEIFGGSLFVVEDSEIAECRAFLKENYPNGIHCSKIKRQNKIQKIANQVGDFLKNKNCFVVIRIQINKNLIHDYKSIFHEKYGYQPSQKELSLLKRWSYYVMIPRFSIIGIHLLTKNIPLKQITLKFFMEDFKRDKGMDYFSFHNEIFSSSIEKYKRADEKIKDTIEKLTIKPLESKTKAEEIMFSFPDLFVYSIRRIITHKEYNLYNSLKPIFNKVNFRGQCSNLNFFKNQEVPPGIYILHTKAEELISRN